MQEILKQIITYWFSASIPQTPFSKGDLVGRQYFIIT